MTLWNSFLRKLRSRSLNKKIRTKKQISKRKEEVKEDINKENDNRSLNYMDFEINFNENPLNLVSDAPSQNKIVKDSPVELHDFGQMAEISWEKEEFKKCLRDEAIETSDNAPDLTDKEISCHVLKDPPPKPAVNNVETDTNDIHDEDVTPRVENKDMEEIKFHLTTSREMENKYKSIFSEEKEIPSSREETKNTKISISKGLQVNSQPRRELERFEENTPFKNMKKWVTEMEEALK